MTVFGLFWVLHSPPKKNSHISADYWQKSVKNSHLKFNYPQLIENDPFVLRVFKKNLLWSRGQCFFLTGHGGGAFFREGSENHGGIRFTGFPTPPPPQKKKKKKSRENFFFGTRGGTISTKKWQKVRRGLRNSLRVQYFNLWVRK